MLLFASHTDAVILFQSFTLRACRADSCVRPYTKACLSLWERWHAAGVTERVHVRPLRPKSQISASSPKGGAKARFKLTPRQSLHRLRRLRPKCTAPKPPPFTGEVAFAKQMTEGALRTPLSRRIRGASSPINGGAFGAAKEQRFPVVGTACFAVRYQVSGCKNFVQT